MRKTSPRVTRDVHPAATTKGDGVRHGTYPSDGACRPRVGGVTSSWRPDSSGQPSVGRIGPAEAHGHGGAPPDRIVRMQRIGVPQTLADGHYTPWADLD